MRASEKADAKDFDPEGRVLLNRVDLPPLEFDPKIETATITRKDLHLIGRRKFTTANGVEVEPIDYNGFRIEFDDGVTKMYLKLRAGDADYDAIDVTAEVAAGAFIVSERGDE